MKKPWTEVLELLLALQRLDLKIRRMDRELTGTPAALRNHEQAVKAIDDRIRKVEDRARILRAQIKLRENELKAHEQKIARLKAQSSEVRTNREFVAFRSEIANVQGDCDRLQGEVLKILDVVEQADKKVSELQEGRERELGKAAGVQEDINTKLVGLRTERDELLGTRPQVVQGIPPEPLQFYERAHRARGAGLAVLEGSYCSGCGELQTRNDVYAVQNRTRAVLCRSCNRILYQV